MSGGKLEGGCWVVVVCRLRVLPHALPGRSGAPLSLPVSSVGPCLLPRARLTCALAMFSAVVVQ